MTPERQQHRRAVAEFLRRNLSDCRWRFTLPQGSGHETYFARAGESAVFVKLGAHLARYRAMASLGLTPPVLAYGNLEDGTPILVQPRVAGRRPSRNDYRTYLDHIAAIVGRMHRSADARSVLDDDPSEQYKDAGLRALSNLRRQWSRCRSQVPVVAPFVDENLAMLERQVARMEGAGLVASHNDICNANWLIASDGRVYLLDLDSMALDDPAIDLGAILWWYYPPQLRGRFLGIAGYADGRSLRERMRVRMAMHALSIALPREGSFDRFVPESFGASLRDFRAALEGKENPEGYD